MTSTPLLDLFAIEQQLNKDQKMIRGSLRSFSHKVYALKVQKRFREEHCPNDLIPKIGKLGILEANLHGHGCAHLDAASYGLIMRELEYVDSGYHRFGSIQGALCMSPVYAFGSEERKQRHLHRMATSKLIAYFGHGRVTHEAALDQSRERLSL